MSATTASAACGSTSSWPTRRTSTRCCRRSSASTRCTTPTGSCPAKAPSTLLVSSPSFGFWHRDHGRTAVIPVPEPLSRSTRARRVIVTLSGLRQLAEQQHGVVSRRQCRALGLGADALESVIHAGDWEPLSPRLLHRQGAPRTAQFRVMAAVLDTGIDAVASHRTAAWLWRLPGFYPSDPEASLLRGNDGEGGTLARIHRPRS